MKKPQLTAYLTAGVAATTVGQADAATVVTLFGPGARGPATNPATTNDLELYVRTDGYASYATFGVKTTNYDSVFAYFEANGEDNYFTRGTDLTAQGYFYGIRYYEADFDTPANSTFRGGAVLGDQNYARINLDVDGGNDTTYEAIGQFYFDAAGGGYLVALAVNEDNTDLNIVAGKAAIDAIPEPTTAGLLALGAAGLATMRHRKRA